jgi:hypothetical protein
VKSSPSQELLEGREDYSMADDFYVYLLVDSDPAGLAADQIFYVGKGRDSRALHHALEYVDAVKNNSLAEAVSKLAQTADPSAVEADVAPVEHAKVQRIRKIVDAGRDVRLSRVS